MNRRCELERVRELSRVRAIALVAAGAAIGVGLLAISYLAHPARRETAGGGGLAPAGAADPAAPGGAVAAPTWALLPARQGAQSSSGEPGDAALVAFYRALLIGDTDTARNLLIQLSTTASDSAAYSLARARLALATGNLQAAEIGVWEAVERAPGDAAAWALLGVVLDRAGETREAEQALAYAEAVDPSLASDLWPTRWQAALNTGGAAAIAALADDYANRSASGPLASYYRAEALIAADAPADAIRMLVAALEQDSGGREAALLWYTLGRAYLAYGSFGEAAVALETAAYRLALGDTSVALASEQPVEDLNEALARAYLRTDRCPEAEAIFQRLASSDPTFDALVQAAIVCQTPTPTLTPWIPRQIGTVTPLPP